MVYMTNFGLAIESKGVGMVLDLGHDDVLSFLPTGKGFVRLAWDEGGRLSELVLHLAESACSKYRQVREDYANLLNKFGLSDAASKPVIENPSVSNKRFEKIPEHVDDSEIWNDCWFDKTRNIFVTHNAFFKSWNDLRARPHQIEYRIDSGDDGIVVSRNKVTFKFGLPAVKLPASKGSAWFLLPTMSDAMSSRQTQAARFAKDIEERIDFVV
jgi:hypothetical protein